MIDIEIPTLHQGKITALHTGTVEVTSWTLPGVIVQARCGRVHTVGEAVVFALFPDGQCQLIEKGQDAPVTGVKGENNEAYMHGDVNLTYQDVGAASDTHTHADATQALPGFMSCEDKEKLDALGPYKAGDTFTTTETTQFPGACNNAGTGIFFTVNVPHSLEDITAVTVSTCKGIVYGLSGRVDSHNSSSYNWLTNYTVTASKIGDHCIKVIITTSGSFTGTAANQPLIVSMELKLTFA